MNVRQSGSRFDWGGCTLEAWSGAGMNFLTTAVIIEEADEKAKNAEHGGDDYGMGKIMGRFVLAPRWSDEEEWVVNPEDLKIDEWQIIQRLAGLGCFSIRSSKRNGRKYTLPLFSTGSNHMKPGRELANMIELVTPLYWFIGARKRDRLRIQ
ncbi:predicted protein [Verticillium alfalfae VaMs.102]|uniref:Predicted protein n=1 Tax=Verticillium alfalfae (strain VaMs.102 / ATCC MYA-4576 / FGSC 10136) TaxID=526221 RepID=C9S8H3_VERA1|nr:predicted protein [Verticillium alfalfae VaMs.102]EEY13934.1 predicted protein [Verticillium alfalfae VaMs.102]